MATIEQLGLALKNADKAGDAAAATRLAAEIRRMQSAKPVAAEQEPAARDTAMGKLDATVRGAADMLSFGVADEIAAGGDALFNPVFGTGEEGESIGERYEKNLKRQRQTDAEDAEERSGYRLAGQLAGGVSGGVGLAKSGLSLTANAIDAGKNLGRVAMASAREGAILGGLHGLGSGEGVDDRIQRGVSGGVAGGVIGGAAPYAVSGLSKVGGALAAPLMARLRPQDYADKALGEVARRSGMTTDDIVAALARSQADEQGMFTVADATGHAGQRMLSTVARTPNNERQAVVDALLQRQMGQGDRLSNFLAEGFDAADTAAQREAALTAARKATADVNYAAARKGAKPVNLNSAIDEIDRLLGRDPILGDSALSAGPLGSRLKSLRDQLSRDGEQLIDFDRVLNIKSDLYQQMKRNPQAAGDMRSVYNQLDEALEKSSDTYRAANDTYRKQSGTIEAVDLGRGAASGRRRSADTIPQFDKLSPEDQAAFRAGYVDPLITKVEASAMAPGTNKARPLMTSKTGEEFPAFAAEGKAEQLGNRIAREQRMFETSNAALGGSKTADNLADMADMNQFDPAVITSLLRGRVLDALVAGGTRAINEAKGLPPRVIEQVGRSLMETDPNVARELLEGGAERLARSDRLRAAVVEALTNSGASVFPRME